MGEEERFRGRAVASLTSFRSTYGRREAELPLMVDVGALHALLHKRGEADLAAALLLRLTPEGARDLAAMLARFRRRYSTPGLFRSYTRLLDVEGARHVDLAVAFLCGADHAGCRVYPDPETGGDEARIAPARPRPLYRLPTDDDSAGDGEDADASAAMPHERLSPGIMPPWLPRPRGSSWDR